MFMEIKPLTIIRIHCWKHSSICSKIAYLNSKNISNLAETPLPPNILQAGQKQIKVSEGKILFGPDIGHCRTNSPKNVSVSDIKSRIANKNIFKR